MSDPLSPKSPRKGKHVNLRVQFLDDTVHAFPIPVKSLGITLWEAVCQHLQLLEADYFDLEYIDNGGLKCWVDRQKPLLKQLPTPDTPLSFCTKFYTPDPGLLEDDFTRYLFALQIKQDLLSGVMPCSDNTAALLASYIAQAEIGDFLVDDYLDHTYLSSMKFVPSQTPDLEEKIMEYHKQHIGESPAEADLNLLDTARKVELYGIKMFPAKDHEAVTLTLAVAHMGVQVFQNATKINTFSWAKIRKLSFKRKKFLIKLHPESYVSKVNGAWGYYKDTVEFFFDSRNECKGFWKKCIEHHGFFRCQAVRKVPRNKTRVVSRGSSFRYSGRTQKQLMEFVRGNIDKRQQFERSASGRISSRSTSVTPKITLKTNTHNSSDLHNSTASSGSHTLDITQDNHVSPMSRVETAEVHSDSSMSGSRSLGSPKLEHIPVGEATAAAMMRKEDSVDSRTEADDRVDSPRFFHPSNSPSGFKAMDRKFSAPVLGSRDMALSMEDEHRLSRCPEVENIPEVVQEDDLNLSPPNRLSLMRSTSATTSSPTTERTETLPSPSSPSPPPPPPPPILDESDYPLTPPSKNKKAYMIAASTVSTSSFGIPSNISTLSTSKSEDHDDIDIKKKVKRHPVDSSYYIAKELLMTERTYKKDLELVCVWFRNALSGDTMILNSMVELVFSYLDPIYEFHCSFLKDVDQRLSMWEGKSNAHQNGDYQRIGDIVLNALVVAEELYCNYLDRQEEILSEVESKMRRNRKFEELYKDFEAQKVCYLPLNTFFLKPGQRLLHFKLILEKLVKHYSLNHADLDDCTEALAKVTEVTTSYKDKLKRVENLQKMIELQRDLVGIENVVNADRDFIREGCLQKFSRKGYQQRMFFLFSDMLVYTSRTATSLLQFKVHGQLPLRGMIVEETDQGKVAVQNCFAIYAGNKYILVAASCQEEKDKWIEDLNEAIVQFKCRTDDKLQYASLKSSASSTENMDGTENHQDGENASSPSSPEKTIQHRANTTMHVCWHRNTSVSQRDHQKAVKNQLSGYLLRKFKNSNGWQKLWVVFTNFCLFFYKTYQDDFPLASLPLLGYAVNTPDEEDGIHKDHVFKLQFKNHVYFFRAESEYTFARWMEVINSATNSSRRVRLFSRLDSKMEVDTP
ncbi:FERM, ARHGEF and pleckstrin domain-containing protein 2-like isoform X2 [Haliotis rufescens]|uniref:FERM, ARHGEF and pleckstrin domain-containing protein 2-like isoform X2 n=1 Tax=Haliotis rufescens TaxID=6454 RepID=UPI00201ECBA9|nr:FERM, ARHGEF and pleckstrin domain-containing protein 2-like isoform X2 [Haliotis rufescens]